MNVQNIYSDGLFSVACNLVLLLLFGLKYPQTFEKFLLPSMCGVVVIL